jgi:hypothetical protein
MPMKIPLSVLCLAATISHAVAQTPTWHEDISCIVYTHCTPCHHEGGAAHFGLETYQEAHWARYEIKDATQVRYMPPWPPDPNYRALAHERVLTQEEIDLIAAWVDGGAPEGDPANALPIPTYDDGWVITDPEITAIMDEFVIPSSTSDLYRCFVLQVDNPEDRYITGIEVIPGNSSMVHHVLVYQDNTGLAQQLDAQDPAPGYTSFGGIGVPSAKLLGAWVPGSGPFFTPEGMGIKLLAGADVVIQVHYPANSSSTEMDSTRVNLRMTDDPSIRNLSIEAVLGHTLPTLQNGPLMIPAGQVRTFHSRYTVPAAMTATAIAPHAHLICTSMWSFAVLPNGDTIPLIDIPNWDFSWQDFYSFRNPIHVPAGTQLHGYATYDNTANNPNNPNSPPQLVTLGEATTDEMMLFFFAYTPGSYQDTLIVVDDGTGPAYYNECTPSMQVGVDEAHDAPLFRAWPSPAREELFVHPGGRAGVIRLLDPSGRVVQQVRAHGDVQRLEVGHLAGGIYVVEFHAVAAAPLRTKVLLE